MTYSVEIEGFEGQKIEIKPASLLSNTKLLVNGELAPKGPQRGQMLLQKNDGTEVIATWQPNMMGFDIPTLVIDGKTINVIEPLQWYELLWSGLPILLVFIGGMIGAFVGCVGVMINLKVFRAGINAPTKFLFGAMVSAGTALAYFLLAAVFHALIGT